MVQRLQFGSSRSEVIASKEASVMVTATVCNRPAGHTNSLHTYCRISPSSVTSCTSADFQMPPAYLSSTRSGGSVDSGLFSLRARLVRMWAAACTGQGTTATAGKGVGGFRLRTFKLRTKAGSVLEAREHVSVEHVSVERMKVSTHRHVYPTQHGSVRDTARAETQHGQRHSPGG
eukprot:362226-Chlamydomonas_euryale.AAC.5